MSTLKDLFFPKDREPGSLTFNEPWWRDHQKWFESHGYMLRPRYFPDWVPSWKDTGKVWLKCEDGQGLMLGNINDATRISDGSFVSLKKVIKNSHPYEAEIGSYFSSEPLASDPRNHCVPILEVLEVPDDEGVIVIVMPLLRFYNNPRFDTFGEAVEYFRQIFEGLQFMHEHHVAHRDCMDLNIMMDATPLYPEPYHPRLIDMKRDLSGPAKPFTRTQKPVKYYLIDFGISSRYKPEYLPALEVPILGGDKTVPEFQNSDTPHDPFPTDIYYIGNMVREDFLQGHLGFEFMTDLIADMVQDDPSKRPTMSEVVTRFETIRSSLSSWKLRSRVIKRDRRREYGTLGLIIGHWFRRIKFVAKRVPPIPTI